jgi:hypothetical protein
LHGKRLSEPNLFNHPFRVISLPDRLVVLDRFTSPTVRVLDARTGRGVLEFGHSGDAYAQGGWTLAHTLALGDSVALFDATTKTMYVFDVALATGYHGSRSISFSKDLRLTDVQPLAGGRFLATGFLEKGRYALLDHDGTLLREFGPLPNGVDDTIQYEVRQQAYLTNLATDPSGMRVVSATQYGDRIEILDSRGTVSALGERPDGREPIFRVMVGRNKKAFMGQTDSTRLGYLSLATTTQYVYALYSGRARAEGMRRKPHLGTTVRVFDWKGHLVRTFGLDRDAIAIAVDANDSTLFSIAPEPVAVVVKYLLPRPASSQAETP